MVILLALLAILAPSLAHAAVYWTSPSGAATLCSEIDGEADPGQYMTMDALRTSVCAAAGDTVIAKSGTYTGTHIPFNLLVPNGASPASPSKVICEGDRTCIIQFGGTSVGTVRAGNIQLNNGANFTIGERGHGFVSDCESGGSNCRGFFLYAPSTAGVLSHVTIEGNEVINHHGSGIGMSENQPSQYYTNVTIRYNKIAFMALPISLASGDPHAIYLASRDSLVEHNDIESNHGYGIQCWHIATDITLAYNHITTDNDGRGITCQDAETSLPTNNLAHHNVIISADGLGACLHLRGNSAPMRYYNNTCINYPTFYATFNGAGTTSEVKNNVCTGGCARTIVAGTSIDCGGTCTTTNPTVTASSNFVNASAGDVSLIAGSSLINAGLNVGFAFNGSAPDIGAMETFACQSASINGSTIDLTCAMNLHTPVQPVSGSTGWSVSCTGSGCGTPTASNVSRKIGSSSILTFNISGITGGACASGQTWTLSYSSTTGTVTDSSLVGAIYNQRLHAFGPLAITNGCTGGGGGGPTGPHVYYKFNGNGNDDSGNGLTATLSGTSFVPGKFGQGLQTNVVENDYAESPYGSGIDPTTQSLTIAGGVFVDAADVNGTRGIFGSPLGGANQRLYITRQNGTFRIGIQNYAASTASEFTVQPGWNHVCLVMDSATDTARLSVNGVAGSSAGAVRTYTSYATLGNFRIGLPSGFTASSGGAHVFDEWKIWNSVQDCTAIYQDFEPPSSTWTGNISMSNACIYGARVNVDGQRVPLGGLNANAIIGANGAFSVITQLDGTVADPSPIGTPLYYKCLLCPSAGTELAVPDTPGTDGVSFFSGTSGSGLLSGDHGAALSGSLTRIPGDTMLTSGSIPFFDLPLNGTIVNGYILQFHSSALGRTFCFYPKEQSGLALNGINPSGGICVTAGTPSSIAGY